ncbi:mod(mdg4) family protein [Megaselia abdita]
MADDEQFSLCWNNFNTNLSAGFHESLCRGDLVDVTLAAEGQFVKAHRLVLSVCSPYFRKMFTTMPANQHAFVFLKDVSHSALKDLIQFMYCGEVNVKQDALPAFISTAEALQIKGLTDGDPAPAQSPTKHSTPAHQTLTRVRQPATRPQQTTTSRSYKIETIDDSGDEVLVGGKTTTQIVLQTSAPPTQTAPQQSQNVVQTNQGTTVVSQKRPAGQRSISSAQTKRIKTQTVVSVQQNDPLEAVGATETTTLQAVQSVAPAADKSDTEFIDLPIDLPTKSEPDYSNAEDAGEVDQTGEQETYVEDDSYGDMKYDESYFTENEDQTATGATATSVTTSTPAIKQQFGETSYTESGDQSGAEAQDEEDKDSPHFVTSKYGTKQLLYKQHTFNRHVCREEIIYWRCAQFAVLRCKARIRTKNNVLTILNDNHNHEIITKARKYGSLKKMAEEQRELMQHISISDVADEIICTTETDEEFII